MNFSLDRMARAVSSDVEDQLLRTGVIYRLFSRAKTEESIIRKQQVKKYDKDVGKLMQDIIGVRITLYFVDDVDIIRQMLRRNPNFVDETIDEAKTTVFKPVRVNLIFRLSDSQTEELKESAGDEISFLDNTYEVQIRTVLSEGWHEVDHDLRYKCRDDWQGHQDLERAFNGVFASLETNDWSTLMIFKTLAHRHYKDSNWTAMIRTKFRLRFGTVPLDGSLVRKLDEDHEYAKKLFRLERERFLHELIGRDVRIPLNVSNMVYLANCIFFGDSEVYQLTPVSILKNKEINKLVH